MSYLLKQLYLIALIHYLVYYFANQDIKKEIDEDVDYMNFRQKASHSLLYYLVYERPYRNLFYHRIGHKKGVLLGFLLPPQPFFSINEDTKIAGGQYVLNHPWCTRLAAKRIGKHLTIRQNTTLGMARINRPDTFPTIGDNVDIGAHSIIIGDIKIGNNVIIAAGSVVIRDVPDNCMVAGNPAVIKKRLLER